MKLLPNIIRCQENFKYLLIGKCKYSSHSYKRKEFFFTKWNCSSFNLRRWNRKVTWELSSNHFKSWAERRTDVKKGVTPPLFPFHKDLDHKDLWKPLSRWGSQTFSWWFWQLTWSNQTFTGFTSADTTGFVLHFKGEFDVFALYPQNLVLLH